MEREVNPKLKQYQSKIIQVLTNRNIETSPENIINYIAQTILELESDALIMQLYSILFVYKDFVKNSDLITSLILSHIETAFQEKAYRLIRIILNNDRHSINLFKNLLDIFYKTNDKRLRSILELFNIKSEFAVQLYDDNNFIRFYNLYFDELIGKLDFKSRLTNFNTKYAYNLLLKYTNYIINGPKIDQGNLCEKNINLIFCIDKNEETIKISMDLQKVELEYIINLLVSNKDYCGCENTIMKIINQITNYNNIHFLKTKNFVIDLSKNLKNLIKDILTSKSTDLKLAEEFFYINRLFLIPHYISVIREITSVKLLQIIASAVDINVLSQIIKLDVNLLKFSTNNDISVFFSLYEQDNLIINIMPTFLDYCTDHQNLIVKLSDFFCTKIPTDFFVICTTMRNILRSHELNIKKDLILRNLIPKEMSKNIIREITKHELFKVIICHYQHSAVVNDLLFTLGKYIPNLEEDGKIIVDEILLGNLTNLHLLKFFISGMTISLEFLSKLLDECKKNKDYQKKFYEILYYLEKFNKINIDICSDIYADDAISSLQANSLKWRIQYLYLRYTKKCCNSSDYCFINFLMALTSSLYLGNKSCTDVCEGILDDLMISNNKNILLGFIEDNIKNNDINIRCGCLKAYEFILRNYFKDLHLEYMVHIYNYLFKIYKNINALIIIKILCNYIQFTEGVVTKDLIDIIEYYIDTKKKKYRKDLKHLVSLIIDTKSLDLNRRIKQYYKFKIKTDTEEIIIKKI